MTSRNPKYMGDFVSVMCKKSILFAQPIDVLSHMFTVIGSGVDDKNFNASVGESVYNNKTGEVEYQYYTFGDDIYDALEVQTPMYVYAFDDNPRYQPFTKFRGCDEDTRRGIKKALEYFIKCIELATLDTTLVALRRDDTLLGVSRNYDSSSAEVLTMAENNWKDILVWQQNIHILKDELNHL